MGPGQGRDLLELIPNKNKTVWIDQPRINYVFGGLIPLVIGVALLGFGVCILLDALFNQVWAEILSAMGALVLGGLITFVGVVSLYVVIDSSRCLTLEALRSRLNVSEDALIQATREKQILPRYDIMGRIVYRPSDFTSLSLLRASSSPLQANELLRAGTDKPISADVLLRGSGPPDPHTQADSNPSLGTTGDTKRDRNSE